MELLLFVFLWPFLVLSVGLVFISLSDLTYGVGSFAGFLAILFLGAVIAMERSWTGEQKNKTYIEQLEDVRHIGIIFSIGLLLPIFTRYFIDALGNSLASILLGLVLGFALALWGIFIKNNKTLTYGNIVGGFLILCYVYTQLWTLGELPRIIAAAFGLAVAVIVAVVKLRDRLV